MSQWNGKGSRPRPLSVPREVRDANWDAIFSKDKKTDAEKFDDQVIMKDELYESNPKDSDEQ